MNTKAILRTVNASSEPAYLLARITGWNYWGDINPEHGGVFWRWSNEDHTSAECVEVSDAPEHGSGNWNDDWNAIEDGEIDLPLDPEDADSSLATCGWEAKRNRHGELLSVSQGDDEITDSDELAITLLKAHHANWGLGAYGATPRYVPTAQLLKTLVRRLKSQATVCL